MIKTMQDAAADAAPEETTEEVVETTTPPEDSSTEGTTTDQVATEGDQPQGEGESEANQTTTTTDFDPIAYLEALQDPNLSEDQKVALKNGFLRQQDYTKKTQTLAEERKLVDEYRTLKPFIDRIFQDGNLYSQVFGENPGQPTTDQLEYPEDPREYAAWLKEQTKRETINEMRQEMAMDADRQQASTLDPRLNTDRDFAEEIAGIIALDQAFINGQKSATQATQEALERFKAREQLYEKRVTTRQQEKLRSKKMVSPTTGNSASRTSEGKLPSSMREAAEMAEQELTS